MTTTSSSVLIVDDDPAIGRLLSNWLTQSGYHVEHAPDGEAALEAIALSCPHFLVTDWEMPGMSGLELCERVRQAKLPHYIYTVVLTGRDSAQDMVQALTSGADDFARKPVEKGELLARLRSGGRVVDLEHRLSLLANSDPLTGLLTKRMFAEHLQREWERARRHRLRLSCVMLDIDFFKKVNDTHGHPFGDEVIRTVARLIAESCRKTDIVGRFGGEEFCAILPETNEEQAVVWAERLREAIRSTPVTFDDKSINVTASLGVAEIGAGVDNAQQFVDLADHCLLAAKHAGRDRVVSHADLRRIEETCHDPTSGPGSLFDGVKAKDVMTIVVACLPEEGTIGQATRYFLRFRLSSAPVVGSDGKLVGFLSEKDAMNVLLWPNCWTRPIRDVMKSNVVCYEEDTPVLTVYEFLCRTAIRSVVISRDGVPTGMISRGTLLRWFSNLAASLGNGLPRTDEASTADAMASRGRLAMTTATIGEQVRILQTALADAEVDDVLPYVVGGVSRIQDLVNDLLAGSRTACTTRIAAEPADHAVGVASVTCSLPAMQTLLTASDS